MPTNKIAFIVDSSIGLYGKDIVSNDVKQVFFRITDSNNTEYLDDNSILTSEKILEEFLQNKSFKTSAVSPGLVIAAAEELFEKYEKIIVFTISSGISSYYQNVLFLQEEYKDKLFIVDTKEVGYSIHFLLNEVKKQLKNGATVEQVVEYANNFYKLNATYFTCESWEPLARSGRAPMFLAKAFDKLNTRPIINFFIKNRLGGVVRGKGEKGFYKSVEKIIENIKKVLLNPVGNEIEYCVFYNNKITLEKAKYIKDVICQSFKITAEKIIESFVPNVVLVHVGSGSFGLNIRVNKNVGNRE